MLDGVLSFLNGDYKQVIDKLKADMTRYAMDMQYEKAAVVRDTADRRAARASAVVARPSPEAYQPDAVGRTDHAQRAERRPGNGASAGAFRPYGVPRLHAGDYAHAALRSHVNPCPRAADVDP